MMINCIQCFTVLIENNTRAVNISFVGLLYHFYLTHLRFSFGIQIIITYSFIHS